MIRQLDQSDFNMLSLTDRPLYSNALSTQLRGIIKFIYGSIPKIEVD
jgi:uncharacterized protein YlaN (UPF0358 family)